MQPEQGPVAVDFGAPGAPAVDTQGKEVKKEVRFDIPGGVDAAKRMAKHARATGDDEVADRIDAVVGETTTATFVERHPLAVGIVTGAVVGAGLSLGTVYTVRAIRRRRLAKLGGARVRRING